MARLARYLATLVLVLTGSVLLSACGSNGAVSEARQSCRYVASAIRLQIESDAATATSEDATRLRARALGEIIKATSYAAQATSSDGSWNPLMTTLGEAQRVPLEKLFPALKRICSVANSNEPYLGS